MVRVYVEVKKTFTTIVKSHYIFTPRDLTKWLMGLMRYASGAHQDYMSLNDVFFVWSYESCRVFRDKLVSQEEKFQFTNGILLPAASQLGITNLKEEFKG